MVIMGQPDTEAQRIDNPLVVTSPQLPDLRHQARRGEGPERSFPATSGPTIFPLLYYSYHIMAGLGTLLRRADGVAALLLWRGKLFTARWMLWMLMLASRCPISPTPPAG